jgi:zinc-dependent metalloproteinase lipoprotein
LEGLKATDKTFITKSNLAFPYCISINECYASAGYDSKRYTAFLGKDRYNSSMVDVSSTLAHELGHYLGLLHVFAEKDNGEYADDCKDTDHCEDTPSYNKLEYEKWLTEYLKAPEISFSKAIKRTNCEGEEFNSHNIMDYSVTCADRISEDQYKRIRNVLYYSPLIPGPKKNSKTSTETRASYNDEIINLPITIRK